MSRLRLNKTQINRRTHACTLLLGLFKGLAWRVTLITTTFFLVNKLKVAIAPVAFPDKADEQ